LALIQRLARNTCPCGEDGCLWWSLAEEFFDNNTDIDRERLAASLRKIVEVGPCKEARVPLIIGTTNCGKSTVLDNVKKVFGKKHVLSKPKIGAPNGALGRLAKDDIRFIYFDDFRPVDYASLPEENPTIPATEFLALMCGQPFNIQVSQSFNDGHPTQEWHRGIAMTAKAEGLWEPNGRVTSEEVKHMKARVEVFHATHVVGENPDDFETSPACAESWCRWVLVDSVAYAARERPRTISAVGRRAPLALPPMPKEASTGVPTVGQRVLSAYQKARVDANRRKAVERSAKRPRLDESSTLPTLADEGEQDEQEDPFGFAGLGCDDGPEY
jgi:hypothetical protein